MVAFDEVTMEWTTVSCIRMDKQDTIAHALAFKKTSFLMHIKEDIIILRLTIGETLLGIVVDWSDAEIRGLACHAVGKNLATKLAWLQSALGQIMAASKGSYYHFTR